MLKAVMADGGGVKRSGDKEERRDKREEITEEGLMAKEVGKGHSWVAAQRW